MAIRDPGPRQYRGQASLPLSNLFLKQIFPGKAGGGGPLLDPNMMTKERQGPSTLFSLLPFLHLTQVAPHLLQVPAGPVFVLSLEHCTPGSCRAQTAPQTTGLARDLFWSWRVGRG